MTKRLQDSRTSLANAERNAASHPDPVQAFRLAAWRLITGNDDLPAEWTSVDFAGEAKDLGALRQRVHSVALHELAGGDAAREAKQLLADLDSYQVPSAHRLRVIASAVGLADLCGDAAALHRWLGEAEKSVYKDASIEELLFETLRVAQANKNEIEIESRAVARALHDAFRAPAFFDAAPPVLALARLCRSAKKKLRETLLGALVRVEELDAGLSASDPEVEEATRVGRKATLTLRVLIDGKGTFDPGADPACAFSYALPATLLEASDKARRSRGEKRKLMENALARGVTRLTVSLGDDVALSAADEAVYSDRVALAWKLASSRIDGLGGSYELTINGGARGD